jgi:DegV family protein with EDD domain
MASVRIVTDSSCDLPQEVADQHGISIVPLSIRFGDEEFTDREELSTDEFWAKCRATDLLPETAAPSPGRFEQTFRALAAEGATSIITINLSSGLSATIEAARNAQRAVAEDLDVRIIDSQTVSVGVGALAVLAAEAAEAGKSADEIEELVNDVAGRTRVHAALDTLENLKKGGRIGGAQSMLGSLLSIKPLIEVRNGVVEPNGKQRTRSRALDHLVKLVTEEADNIERLAVLHAACDDVDALVDRRTPLVDGEILVGQIGPVVGAHAGIGTIGVTFQVAAKS